MNSPQSLNKDHEASRHEDTSSTSLSTLPSNRSSPPPASLSSLPTELLTRILNHFPLHPASKRSKFLARICLVNKFLLSIAQPLLFRDIHLKLDQDYDEDYSQYRQLVRILTSGHPISKKVRNLRVSFRGGGTNSIDMAVFAFVLSCVGPLESIRTSWWHDRGFEHTTEFIEAILRHQEGLKRLDIPNVHFIGSTTLPSIFTDLPDLEAFVATLPSPSDQITSLNSACQLRRLVITTSFDLPLFQQITHNSYSSLTSLSVWLTTIHDPVDLSHFSNLSLLRIDMAQGGRYRTRAVSVTDPSTEDVFDFLSHTMRRTLESLRTLPIKTLSISTTESNLKSALMFYPFLDVLPPSIVHFAAVPPIFMLFREGPNQLIQRTRDRSYPHLKLVSILPGLYHDQERSRYVAAQQGKAEEGLMEKCKELGVKVEITAMESQDPLLRMGVDVDQEDSETEMSDFELPSDSEDGDGSEED